MNPRDDLKAFLDGELPPEQMAEMREAIDRDPMLAQEAKEIEAISASLRLGAAQPSAAGLEATLAALSRNAPKERRPWWPWLVPVAAMAGALVFVVGPTVRGAKTEAMSLDGVVAYERSAAKSPVDEPAASVPNVSMDYPDASRTDGASTLQSKREQFSSGMKPQEKGVAFRKPASGQRALPSEQAKAEHRFAAEAKSNPLVAERNRSRDRKQEATLPAPVMNARPGTLEEGQDKPDYGQFKNFPTYPRGIKMDATGDVANTLQMMPSETLIVEVESVEDAEAAIRSLAGRMGASVQPLPIRPISKQEFDSSTAQAKVQSLATVSSELRLTFDVAEDRVEEAKKRVTDAVREASRARRETAQGYGGGGFGGGGFGGGGGRPAGGGGNFAGGGAGGFGSGQQNETQSGATKQTGSQSPTQSQQGGGPLQQNRGVAELNSASRDMKDSARNQAGPGGPGGQSLGAPGKKQNAPAKSKDDYRAKRQMLKPRKRIEVILKIKPKAPGKLEE